MGNVPDHRGSLAILPPEDARETYAAPRILVAQPQSAGIVREVDRTVLLHDKIIGAVELLAVEIISQRDPLAVLLDPVDAAARPSGDHQATLAVERKPVRPDHGKFLVARIVLAAAIGLHEADAPDVETGIAAMIQVERLLLAIGRQFVDPGISLSSRYPLFPFATHTSPSV